MRLADVHALGGAGEVGWPGQTAGMTVNHTALAPKDLTRLFVEPPTRGDARGIAARYKPAAVIAYPLGEAR
jgi:hypothetical protein